MTPTRTRTHPVMVWCLWDAAELVSSHPTRADADAARACLLAEHLNDFPHDRNDLEAALMIEPTPHASSDPEAEPTGGRSDRFQVWALWDIVALHATEHGAHAARQAHLRENAETDPDAQALLERSVHVTSWTVRQP